MISTLASAGIIAAEAGPDIRQAVTSFYRKLYIADNYRPSAVLRVPTSVTLIRASDSFRQVESLGEDYGLSAVYDGKVDIRVIQGTHESVIADAEISTQLAHLFDTVLSA